MDAMSRALLTSVLSLPTMSFHETAIATFVRWYSQGLGLKVDEDDAGNLVVRYSGGKKGSVTYTAHMDHPGFEVVSSKGKTATVALWGKVAPKTFAGSKVVVYTSEGSFKGRIEKRVLAKKHLGRFCFALKASAPVAAGDFGHYDLPAIKMKKDRIETRAADNLISVTAILDLFTRLAAARSRVNVTGLFTRGEEAGFLGAFAAMELGSIPKADPLIVLECSSAAGGNCVIGAGPVIRAGDLQSTYDPAVDVWMSDVAARIKAVGTGEKKSGGKFGYQRALLQGGRCEACVYVAEGYRTGGIAMPLGNYHNQGPRGYAAEYVSGADYEKLITLMAALAHSPMPKDTMRAKVSPIWKHYRGLKRKLISSR